MLIMRDVLFSILCMGLSFSLAFSAEKKPSTLKDLYKTADNTVVFITAGGKVQGSGVSIKNANLLTTDSIGTIIVTNAHVTGGFNKVSIKTNKKTEFVGTVVVSNKNSDLALVQIEGMNLPISPLASADSKIEVGDSVFAVGSPKGLSNSLSSGIVSGIRQRDDISMIQTTAAISKGSSGGGLFNSTGKLIGITTFKIIDGENVNFSVHVKHIYEMLYQSISKNINNSEPAKTEDEMNEIARRKLKEIHPDWENIVTSTEFEEWIKKQPKDVQDELNESWDPHYVADKISIFKQSRTNTKIGKNSTDPNQGLIDFFIKSGKYFAEQKQYENAISGFNSALELDPNNAMVYELRGDAYENLNQISRALADYDESIRLDSKNPYSYLGRGNIYYGLKDFDRALADYNNILRIEPDNLGGYIGRANVYKALKRYEHAITDYDEAIRLYPKRVNSYYMRGISYQKINNYERAIADYDVVIRLDPKNANAYNNRGSAYMDLKNYQNGCADAAKACDLGVCNSLNSSRGRRWCK